MQYEIRETVSKTAYLVIATHIKNCLPPCRMRSGSRYPWDWWEELSRALILFFENKMVKQPHPNHRVLCLSTIGWGFLPPLFYHFVKMSLGVLSSGNTMRFLVAQKQPPASASQWKVFTLLFVSVLTYAEATLPFPSHKSRLFIQTTVIIKWS